MSKDLPFYKFYPTEWLLGRINTETIEIQITFLKICCWYWHKDCHLLLADLKIYIDEELIRKVYQKKYIKYDKKTDLISIKFLDEQKMELQKVKNQRVANGRKGGIKSASMRKKKSYEDYIKEAMNHEDPNLRISRSVAEHLIDDKITKGEIIL